MSSIGDKKVALNLSDGTSVNLNKPKVLPADITKIADIKEPGWYIGGTVAGTAPQSLEDESKPVASTADSDNGIAVQTSGSDSIFKLYDDSEINYVITDTPFEDLLTSTIFILYVYPIISKSTGSNAVDGNDPDISGFGYFLMTRYGKLHIGTRTTSAEAITWDQIATRYDIDHIIEYFKQYYIIDNLMSTDTDKALSANQGKVLKDLADTAGNTSYGTELKSGDDLNKIYKNGFYYGIEGAGVENLPNGFADQGYDSFAMLVLSAIYDDASSGDGTIDYMGEQIIYGAPFSSKDGEMWPMLHRNFTLNYNIENNEIESSHYNDWCPLLVNKIAPYTNGTITIDKKFTAVSMEALLNALKPKYIDSSITDLASITESGTYIGTTDFDKTGDSGGGMSYATSSLGNWPVSMIQTWATTTAVPYVLRVTKVTGSSNNRIYYELLCVAFGNQKVCGFSGSDTSNGDIVWTNDITRIEDSLTSYSTESALSANQGRVLNDKISKLTKTDTVGSAANPVYMKNGTITAGTYTFSASTTDLTAGTSTLATNEIRFIYE